MVALSPCASDPTAAPSTTISTRPLAIQAFRCALDVRRTPPQARPPPRRRLRSRPRKHRHSRPVNRVSPLLRGDTAAGTGNRSAPPVLRPRAVTCHVIEAVEELNICSAMTFAAIVAVLDKTMKAMAHHAHIENRKPTAVSAAAGLCEVITSSPPTTNRQVNYRCVNAHTNREASSAPCPES